jgi:hypothetical protein
MKLNEQNIKCLSFSAGQFIEIHNLKKKCGIITVYYISIFGDSVLEADCCTDDLNKLKDVCESDCDKDELEQIINKLADLEDHVKAFHQIF